MVCVCDCFSVCKCVLCTVAAGGPLGSLSGSSALLASHPPPHTHTQHLVPATCVFALSLGGYPYPTHSNKEILDTLLAGRRLEKPKNCNQDM